MHHAGIASSRCREIQRGRRNRAKDRVSPKAPRCFAHPKCEVMGRPDGSRPSSHDRFTSETSAIVVMTLGTVRRGVIIDGSNIPALKQQYGRNYGTSVIPYRPELPGYGPASRR